jgi:hypothetical protein
VQVHEAVCGSFSFPAAGDHTDFGVWFYGRVILSTSWLSRCQHTPLSRAFSNLIHDDTAILSGRRTSTMNVPAFTVARVGKPWSKAFHIGEVMLPDTNPTLLTDRYIVGGKVIATPSRIAVCWVSASQVLDTAVHIREAFLHETAVCHWDIGALKGLIHCMLECPMPLLLACLSHVLRIVGVRWHDADLGLPLHIFAVKAFTVGKISSARVQTVGPRQRLRRIRPLHKLTLHFLVSR